MFDQKDLLFDPVQTLEEMNALIAYRKYELFTLSAAGAPISVPVDKKFQHGEVTTISCPEPGKLEMVVDDQRDAEKVIPGRSTNPYFMESAYL